MTTIGTHSLGSAGRGLTLYLLLACWIAQSTAAASAQIQTRPEWPSLQKQYAESCFW